MPAPSPDKPTPDKPTRDKPTRGKSTPDKPKARVKISASEATPPSQRMPDDNVRPFMEALRRANPDGVTELYYTDPFTLLVAVVLSAQTTDAAVNRATLGLFALASDPFAMAKVQPEQVQQAIRTIGLSNSKARNVVALSQQLVALHHGEVPADRDALEALPGVGRKTANVVLIVIFGQPTMAVDTHIFRIGNRTGLAPGKNVRQVEDGLVARIPADMMLPAHHWLILHGRYICVARKPQCERCLAARWCMYPLKPALVALPEN
jgi:endonuclease-3